MRYVQRDAEGVIRAVYTAPQAQAQEELPDGHPDLVLFVQGSAAHTLGASDLALVRVIEDVVDLLVQKGVIMFTDLPVPAQQKLIARGRMRQSLNPIAPVLTDDSIV